jgi:hypothetical protein
MTQPKPARRAKKVWRISESEPMGGWVHKDAQDDSKPSAEEPEVSYSSWVSSSYDLLEGAEVTEDPDTLPAELFDELFAPKSDGSKSGE